MQPAPHPYSMFGVAPSGAWPPVPPQPPLPPGTPTAPSSLPPPPLMPSLHAPYPPVPSLPYPPVPLPPAGLYPPYPASAYHQQPPYGTYPPGWPAYPPSLNYGVPAGYPAPPAPSGYGPPPAHPLPTHNPSGLVAPLPPPVLPATENGSSEASAPAETAAVAVGSTSGSGSGNGSGSRNESRTRSATGSGSGSGSGSGKGSDSPPEPEAERGPQPVFDQAASNKAISEKRQIIVKFLTDHTTDSELKTLFEPFGPVENARSVIDRKTSHTKGFGFVTFARAEDAVQALRRMTGFPLHGKQLSVALTQTERRRNFGS